MKFYDFIAKVDECQKDSALSRHFAMLALKFLRKHGGSSCVDTHNFQVATLSSLLADARQTWYALRETKIKNVGDLKHYMEASGKHPYFFSKDTMRFFGDTMSNFGLRRTSLGDIPVFCLYRKRPVKDGLSQPFYFNRLTLERVIERPDSD